MGGISLQIPSRDVLVPYADQVTQAQNTGGEFLGETRVVCALQASLRRSVCDIEAGILSAFSAFTGEAGQFDDIALLSNLRESA